MPDASKSKPSARGRTDRVPSRRARSGNFNSDRDLTGSADQGRGAARRAPRAAKPRKLRSPRRRR